MTDDPYENVKLALAAVTEKVYRAIADGRHIRISDEITAEGRTELLITLGPTEKEKERQDFFDFQDCLAAPYPE